MTDISIDKDGKWFYRDKEIIHPEVLSLFKASLHLQEDGRYFLEIGGDRAQVAVADTPYFILRVDRVADLQGESEEYFILIDNGEQETLDPATLSVSPENYMYCRIKGGKFRAKFLRPAYYQLAAFIKEDEATGKFYLPQGSRKFFVEA